MIMEGRRAGMTGALIQQRSNVVTAAMLVLSIGGRDETSTVRFEGKSRYAPRSEQIAADSTRNRMNKATQTAGQANNAKYAN